MKRKPSGSSDTCTDAGTVLSSWREAWSLTTCRHSALIVGFLSPSEAYKLTGEENLPSLSEAIDASSSFVVVEMRIDCNVWYEGIGSCPQNVWTRSVSVAWIGGVDTSVGSYVVGVGFPRATWTRSWLGGAWSAKKSWFGWVVGLSPVCWRQNKFRRWRDWRDQIWCWG